MVSRMMEVSLMRPSCVLMEAMMIVSSGTPFDVAGVGAQQRTLYHSSGSLGDGQVLHLDLFIALQRPRSGFCSSS
jgi:hypothetical protein